MIRSIILGLLILSAINLLLIIFTGIFKYEEKRLVMNTYARSISILVLLAIILIFIDTNNIQNQIMFSIPILFFFMYCMYSTIVFGYKIEGQYFYWYNGLYQKKVSVYIIEKIEYKKDNKRTRTIVIITKSGKNIKIRNDLNIEYLVTEFTKEWNIPVN